MILTRIEDSKTLIVKTRKIGGGGDGTIELSAGENGVVLEDEKKKKKKNDEEHAVSVDDAELSGGRIQGVKESDVKDKKRKNKDILESASNDAGFNDNQNNAVMGSDVLKVKKRKKKSKKMDDCVNDFESGTTQSEAVIEGDFVGVLLKKRRKRRRKRREKLKRLLRANMDLLLRASEEKKSKHGMLRDNISWGAISDKLETRRFFSCCRKWYNQLTSSLVAEGKWRDTDDYSIVIALSNLDACCMEDVDWDNLVDGRSGVTCRKRWNQRVKHLGPGRQIFHRTS